MALGPARANIDEHIVTRLATIDQDTTRGVAKEGGREPPHMRLAKRALGEPREWQVAGSVTETGLNPARGRASPLEREGPKSQETVSAMDIISSERIRAMEVLDSGGARLGSVKDLLIDLWTGRVRYVVVAAASHRLAGALGLGERLVAIPLEALRRDNGQLTLPRGVTALAGAPAFAASRPPAFDDDYERELATYWRSPMAFDAWHGAKATNGVIDGAPTEEDPDPLPNTLAPDIVAPVRPNGTTTDGTTPGRATAVQRVDSARSMRNAVNRETCAHCGARNRLSATYCATCGARV